MPVAEWSTQFGYRIEDWATDPMIKRILSTYRKERQNEYDGDQPLAGRTLQLLKCLENLGRSHITELRLLKIVADCRFNLLESRRTWHGNCVPSFTICTGDLGVDAGTKYRREPWVVLEPCSDTPIEVSISGPSLSCCAH